MTASLLPTEARANALVQSRGSRLALFRCAFAVTLMCVAIAAPLGRAQALPADDSRVQTLRMLGEAYAKDLGLTLAKIEVSVAGNVGSDASAWTKRVVDALAVGYRPDSPNSFRLVSFAALKPILKIKMSGGGPPEDTVSRVVTTGNTITAVTWYFTSANPVKSYAVFSPRGAPLFDTMLLMPFIRGPVLTIGRE